MYAFLFKFCFIIIFSFCKLILYRLLHVLSTGVMSFAKDRFMTMTRKLHGSPQEEPLAPAVNLKMVPGLLVCINCCGVVYFLLMTLAIVATSLSITLPSLYSGAAFWTRLAVAMFILFQVPCTAFNSSVLTQLPLNFGLLEY